MYLKPWVVSVTAIPCASYPKAWCLEAACRAIIALLGEPDVDSPWNCDAGNMIRAGDTLAFNSMARLYATEYGLTERPML